MAKKKAHSDVAPFQNMVVSQFKLKTVEVFRQTHSRLSGLPIRIYIHNILMAIVTQSNNFPTGDHLFPSSIHKEC